MCAKNYENIVRFDKVIAKIIRVHFFASQCRTAQQGRPPRLMISFYSPKVDVDKENQVHRCTDLKGLGLLVVRVHCKC